MKYISTRGGAQPQEFCDILLGGLAPDGGLYLPQTYPQVRDRLADWRKLSYAELAFEILSLYITDIPAADLKAICDKTYTAQTYCWSRDASKAKDIVPLTMRSSGAQIAQPVLVPRSSARSGNRARASDPAAGITGGFVGDAARVAFILKAHGEWAFGFGHDRF